MRTKPTNQEKKLATEAYDESLDLHQLAAG